MASFNHRGLVFFCLVTILVSAMSMQQINAKLNDFTMNARDNQKDNDPDDDNQGRDEGFEDQKEKYGGDIRIVGH